VENQKRNWAGEMRSEPL